MAKCFMGCHSSSMDYLSQGSIIVLWVSFMSGFYLQGCIFGRFMRRPCTEGLQWVGDSLHSFGAQVDDGAPTGPLKRGMAQGGVCSEP